MLSTSSGPNRSHRLNQCILRRRARNLRAKVRALLPVDICCKYDRRNRNVKDMEEDKQNWIRQKQTQMNGLKGKFRWRISQQKIDQLYFQTANDGDQEQRFDKLTDAQIQQIKEDKLYYLGEENLKNFENFLIQKQVIRKRKLDCAKSYQILANAFNNYIPPLKKSKSHHKSKLCSQESFASHKQNHHSSLQKTQRQNLKTQQCKRKWDNARKMLQFQERRKMILVEERSKGIMSKVKMNIKIERAEMNATRIKQRSLLQLEKRKEIEDRRIKKVQTRQKNNRKKGEIKYLQEQLRKTLMMRSPRVQMKDDL